MCFIFFPFAFISLFIFWAFFKGRDCCRCLTKLCMIVGALTILLLCILGLASYGTAVVINTSCFGMNEFLSSPNPKDVLNKYGLTVSDTLDSFVT